MRRIARRSRIPARQQPPINREVWRGKSHKGDAGAAPFLCLLDPCASTLLRVTGRRVAGCGKQLYMCRSAAVMKPNRRGLDSAIAAGVVAAFRAYVLRLVFDPAALV